MTGTSNNINNLQRQNGKLNVSNFGQTGSESFLITRKPAFERFCSSEQGLLFLKTRTGNGTAQKRKPQFVS